MSYLLEQAGIEFLNPVRFAMIYISNGNFFYNSRYLTERRNKLLNKVYRRIDMFFTILKTLLIIIYSPSILLLIVFMGHHIRETEFNTCMLGILGAELLLIGWMLILGAIESCNYYRTYFKLNRKIKNYILKLQRV